MTGRAIYLKHNSTFFFPKKLFLLTFQFLLITSQGLDPQILFVTAILALF